MVFGGVETERQATVLAPPPDRRPMPRTPSATTPRWYHSTQAAQDPRPHSSSLLRQNTKPYKTGQHQSALSSALDDVFVQEKRRANVDTGPAL
ncbi:unnamed protein product [Jaminaea pallidilutea]